MFLLETGVHLNLLYLIFWQSQRSAVLDMFFTNLIYPSCGSVLVCTDAVSRELDIPSVDIPSVDIVVNYDIPSNSQVRFA
jgi:superfamily II DNA/RNA helicase